VLAVETDWQELPELQNLAKNLVQARVERGFSQGRLARETKLSQTQVSLFESGRRLPSLDQFVRFARALDVPLQRLLSGTDRPGPKLKNLAVELRRLGAVDLWVAEAEVPGASRRPEEVISLALAGESPDPRVVETLPSLLSWNEINPAILRGYGIATKILYRLAWLADVAVAIDRQGGFPGGCRRDPLQRFLKAIKLPLEATTWDDLGRPSGKNPISPIWKRWKIGYGATIADFKRRAEELDSARKGNEEAIRNISKPVRILLKWPETKKPPRSGLKQKRQRTKPPTMFDAKRMVAAARRKRQEATKSSDEAKKKKDVQ
jgi:transcriptional regulator with XRE-family HTH domain